MAIIAQKVLIPQGFSYSLEAARTANDLVRKRLTDPYSALSQIVMNLGPKVRGPILAGWAPFLPSRGSNTLGLTISDFDPMLNLLTPAAWQELEQCKAEAVHTVMHSGDFLTSLISEIFD